LSQNFAKFFEKEIAKDLERCLVGEKENCPQTAWSM